MKPTRTPVADDGRGFRKVDSEYLKCFINVIVAPEAADGIDAIEMTEK